MLVVRVFFLGLGLTLLVVACTTTQGREQGKVLCPSCGFEFDALIEKRF